MQGRFLYAGIADRLVHPRDQVTRLWEHWGRPEIQWYHGRPHRFLPLAAGAAIHRRRAGAVRACRPVTDTTQTLTHYSSSPLGPSSVWSWIWTRSAPAMSRPG